MTQKKRSPEVEALMDQKDHLHAIRVLKESDGGKELIKVLTAGVVSCMRIVANDTEYPKGAALKANLSLLTILMNAKDNEEIVDQAIEEALSE